MFMKNRIFIKNSPDHVGQNVKLAGWVQTIRTHGKIIFMDLRDKTGFLQIVFIPSKEFFSKAKEIRPEWVIEVEGAVNERPKNMVNDKVATGQVELLAESLRIISKAGTLPISIEGDGYDISEEKRLAYRYLDLRRPRLKRNLEVRHKVVNFMRQFLTDENFTEVDTPMLTRSTPEGARDFLVPARIQPGKFYALPQSPQQYKQLLMVAGLERYFQIARCLRDEDPRADRQAEHTQLDIEMSFVEQNDILEMVERLYIEIIKNIFPEKRIMQIPFPRLTYKEAQEKYGSDKPDLRKDKNDPNELAFCFVVDFPMFEWLEGEKKWGAMHHPFTKPQSEDPEAIKKNPEDILGYQHDLVLNGYEIGGGSIRNTNLDTFLAVFEVTGHNEAEVKKQFKHYFEAFSYGVPPHGGIAPGIDRFLAVVLNEPNIREVIAFPKTGDNRDLMLGIPAEIDPARLKELHIKLDLPKKD
jgi:aspartyl-tRNA synthetase